MANENKEIGEIVKKCKVLLLDIEGTTTSISFVKDKLFPYAEENVKQFLDSQWEQQDVKEAVTALRKLAVDDKDVEGAVTIPGEDASKDNQIEGLVSSVKWQMSTDRKVGALKQLQGLIWKQGYDKGEIKGHVYEDVSPALEQWRSADDKKVYIYSSGSVQAQKLLFGQSTAGDLLKLIDGHFDTAVGAKQEAASYANIVEKISCKPEEILFLTDIVKEAEAARLAGAHAALVSREGNAPLPTEATEAFPVLHSLAELTVTNKRKPDHQDELPAKIPKTDTENDVKTTTTEPEATETVAISATTKVENPEPEKMEVEEDTPVSNVPKEDNKDIPLVEEVAKSNEKVDSSDSSDVKPVVEDKVEEKESKTEEKQTEKMETEPTEVKDKEKEPKEQIKNGDSSSVNEESSSVVITEIEDVSDKQDNAETNDGPEPVVEEPASTDEMEVLQNVGEVLEKECDDILSKVQDMTNLENISIKPLLNPIAEETMETENTDSNDIVDRILDSEMDLDMKQCTDIDLSTVAEITEETKTKDAVENGTKDDINSKGKNNVVPEEVATKKSVEANGKAEVEKTSDMETNTAEIKNEEILKSETESKEIPEDVSSIETNALKENNTVVDTKAKTEIVKPVSEEKQVDDEPMAEEVTPAVEEAKPTSDQANPTSEEAKRTPEEVKPTLEEVKPTSVELQSTQEEATLKSDETKSATEAAKSPLPENAKLATEEVKPITEQAKPLTEDAKPTLEEAKPTSEDVKPTPDEAKPTSDETKPTKVEAKPTSDENPKAEESELVTEVKPVEEQMQITEEVKPSEESKPADEIKPENDVKEPQINGKATNGDTKTVKLNGDASKDEELSSRLSVGNGNDMEVVNGSNGDSNLEQGQGDNKMETEISDIKVKTVTVEEPRTDPIEQPTEA